MNEFLEILRTPSTLWILTGVILLIVEFTVPGLIIFFFGVGAILTGLLCLAADLSFNTQLSFFTINSIAMLLLLRRFLKPILSPALESDTPNIQEFEGEAATVTEAIHPDSPGKVEFHGAEWRAKAPTALAAGDRVTIVARENLTLTVSKN